MARCLRSPGELAGALLLSLVFGSIHAFGILLAPLEISLSASRGDVSFIYSLAIVSLTAAVYAAPRIIRFGASRVAAICGVVSAAGIIAAGFGHSLTAAFVGYGMLFGFSNGIAYSLLLTRAADSMPQSHGLATGLASAVYGLGAAIAAWGLAAVAPALGVTTAMTGLAVVILLGSLAAAACFGRDKVSTAPQVSRKPQAGPFVVRLWAIYFLGAWGGLMVIAHAAGLMGSLPSASLAPALVAVGNMVGNVGGGFVSGRSGARVAFVVPLTLLALAMAVLLGMPSAGLAALTACGFAYGWLIAAVPVSIRRLQGEAAFAATFGRVFTAWGMAGLLAPSFAGVVFDRWGGYEPALVLALVASLGGIALSVTMASGAACGEESEDLAIRSDAER